MKSSKILNPWWKGFLTSILGTTISIALTFGTSAWMNASKKRAAQRQTAMMVIHDIDEIADALQKKKDREERWFKATNIATYSLEELDSVSKDTLNMALAFISIRENENADWTNDANEKMFTTSMEVHNNLDNTKFTDNVKQCYEIRRKLQAKYNGPLMTYEKPIGREEIKRLSLEADDTEFELSNGRFTRKGMVSILKKKFREKRVMLYMYAFEKRNEELGEYIDKLRELNNENKFLMNITDEDLQEFIEKMENPTQPLKINLLVGTWKSSDSDSAIITYCQDKSFVHLESIDLSFTHTIQDQDNIERFAYIKGYAPIQLKGKWSISGDSIVMEYDTASIHVGDMKTNHADLPRKYLQENQSDLDEWEEDVNRLKKGEGEKYQEIKQELLSKSDAFEAVLDITGDYLLFDGRRFIRQKETPKK